MSDVGVVAAVVGSCAGLGALVWAMLGNPSMPAWIRNRRIASSASPRPAKREVIRIRWKDIEDAASKFIAGNNYNYDLVVALQPDGVSLANLLAMRLSTRYAAIEKRYIQAKRTPFFVFDKETHARSTRISTTHFSPPHEMKPLPRILIVDGVTTFGNALIKAEAAVCKELPGAQVEFHVFALDQPRLAASHPEIMERLTFARCIDNFAVWLSFPWDVQ